MKKNLSCYIIILLLISSISCTQNNNSIAQTSNNFFVANWNVQNLFDTINDPDKNDEEFLPGSEIDWNESRLNTKLSHLADVIKFMNKGNGPDVLGVEEVEHKSLLQKMINNFIKGGKYKIAYSESPDKRGIDNGLIYNTLKFDLIRAKPLKINFDEPKSSRDILHVELKYRKDNEVLHVFVNHWPSRREGLKTSEKFRINAAESLLEEVNKLKNIDPKSNIIILGDFNDMPANISISRILNASDFNCDKDSSSNSYLLNLAFKLFQEGKGTYKYRDHWNMLDQIIISNSLFDDKGIEYECDSFHIIKPDFMVEKGGKYDGYPFPTYGGRKYLGGYSDHFPVGANFILKN